MAAILLPPLAVLLECDVLRPSVYSLCRVITKYCELAVTTQCTEAGSLLQMDISE